MSEFEKLTVKQLKDYIKDNELKKYIVPYSRLKKEELIAEIVKYESINKNLSKCSSDYIKREKETENLEDKTIPELKKVIKKVNIKNDLPTLTHKKEQLIKSAEKIKSFNNCFDDEELNNYMKEFKKYNEEDNTKYLSKVSKKEETKKRLEYIEKQLKERNLKLANGILETDEVKNMMIEPLTYKYQNLIDRIIKGEFRNEKEFQQYRNVQEIAKVYKNYSDLDIYLIRNSNFIHNKYYHNIFENLEQMYRKPCKSRYTSGYCYKIYESYSLLPKKIEEMKYKEELKLVVNVIPELKDLNLNNKSIKVIKDLILASDFYKNFIKVDEEYFYNKNQYELDKTYRDLAYLIIRTYRDEKFIKKAEKKELDELIKSRKNL
jgi:hypothetical protein